MKCHNGNPYFIKLTYTNEIKENPTQYGGFVFTMDL